MKNIIKICKGNQKIGWLMFIMIGFAVKCVEATFRSPKVPP